MQVIDLIIQIYKGYLTIFLLEIQQVRHEICIAQTSLKRLTEKDLSALFQ